ncbi:MAG: agmatinase [Thermoplasmata archaeon]|nr:agmatinase [Thermoplasmata archaeon]
MSGTLFADADAVFSFSKYVILGVPLDVTGTHRRGTDKAPEAIRQESYNFETFIYDLGIDLDDVPIHDMGDLPVDDHMRMEVFDAIAKVVGAGKIPIMLGGEHSLTPHAVEAFSDVSVLIFDAHLDYRNEYEGDKNSHACATRRIDEIISPEKVLPVGIRSICKEEFKDAKTHGLEYITAEKAKQMGTDTLKKHIDSIMPGNIYVSIDMDGIDPSFAPGVGTPEPFGLDPLMIRDIIRHLAKRIVGLDIVEVNPAFDHGNTAALAAKLIRDFIGAKECFEL